MRRIALVAVTLFVISGVTGCRNEMLETEVEKWDVLVTSVDDRQLVFRVPPGLMRTDSSGEAFTSEMLTDGQVLYFIAYDLSGGMTNKPHGFDIRFRLSQIVGEKSGTSIDGVRESLAQKIPQYGDIGEDAKLTAGGREWIQLKFDHNGSFSTTLLDDFYLVVIYTFDTTRTNPDWRKTREEIVLEIVENIAITKLN